MKIEFINPKKSGDVKIEGLTIPPGWRTLKPRRRSKTVYFEGPYDKEFNEALKSAGAKWDDLMRRWVIKDDDLEKLAIAQSSGKSMRQRKKARGPSSTAKIFGGRALKGTARQKAWGEKIRAEKLAEMTEEQARLACDPNGLGRDAKFWINNRDKSGSEIGKFFEQQKEMTRQYNELREAGKYEEAAAIAERYNKLTAEFGF